MSGGGPVPGAAPELRPDRTLGPGHDEFWNWCARGELRLQACEEHGHISWPVTTACNTCGSTRLVWQALSGRGTVVSWCSFARDYYDGVLPLPWPVIVVALEDGPFFLSNPHGFEAAPESIGLPVRLKFRACRDSAGDFALPLFEPAPAPLPEPPPPG